MLSSIVSGIASAVLGALLKLVEAFGIYRTGQKAQKASDDEASLKDAVEARKIDDTVRGLSDDDLDRELRRPGT